MGKRKAIVSAKDSSTDTLSVAEKQRLGQLEAEIQSGFAIVESGWRRVAQSLAEIKESRLYREYGTWEIYCRDLQGRSRQQIENLIAAERVFQQIETATRVAVLPESEYQIRPLKSLPEAERPEVWAEAVERSSGEQPTHAQVKAVVEERKAATPAPVLAEEADWKAGDSVSADARIGPGPFRVLDRNGGHSYLQNQEGQTFWVKDEAVKSVIDAESPKPQAKTLTRIEPTFQEGDKVKGVDLEGNPQEGTVTAVGRDCLILDGEGKHLIHESAEMITPSSRITTIPVETGPVDPTPHWAKVEAKVMADFGFKPWDAGLTRPGEPAEYKGWQIWANSKEATIYHTVSRSCYLLTNAACKELLPKGFDINDIRCQVRDAIDGLTQEHYTPRKYRKVIEAILGPVDLDPFSPGPELATIPSKRWFTRQQNALEQDWTADNIWFQPPYTPNGSIRPCIEKLIESYLDGLFPEALCLVPAYTGCSWFKEFKPFLVGYHSGRITFEGNDSPARFDSAWAYLGEDLQKASNALWPVCDGDVRRLVDLEDFYQ